MPWDMHGISDLIKEALPELSSPSHLERIQEEVFDVEEGPHLTVLTP